MAKYDKLDDLESLDSIKLTLHSHEGLEKLTYQDHKGEIDMVYGKSAQMLLGVLPSVTVIVASPPNAEWPYCYAAVRSVDWTACTVSRLRQDTFGMRWRIDDIRGPLRVLDGLAALDRTS